tara:strand:- start:1249 stop:1791 length:543 start_codon:yes stop_codon:yes gene_type:complete
MMTKLINRLFDRILFTLSFILGVQAPEFMQQYIQRLSGHLDEATHQLKQFQTVADLQFNGDLNLMVARYQANTDTAIAQTGGVIGAMNERVTGFEFQLSQLQNHDYITQLYYFIWQIDLSMAQATLTDFKLAIPIEIGALLTGAIFAITVLLLQTCASATLKITLNKRSGKSINTSDLTS